MVENPRAELSGKLEILWIYRSFAQGFLRGCLERGRRHHFWAASSFVIGLLVGGPAQHGARPL